MKIINYNATVMTSWYNRRGKKVDRNARVKFKAANNLGYNELVELAYQEYQKDPFRPGSFDGVLWFN